MQRFVIFITALIFLIPNDKMLIKNLAKSFTSTPPLVLLPAKQMSQLLLNASFLYNIKKLYFVSST